MRNDVNISQRMLTEYYLPAFKACVQDAKVKSIMCSYNAVFSVSRTGTSSSPALTEEYHIPTV
jgi:xylan 1,4-beta-xylosidase